MSVPQQHSGKSDKLNSCVLEHIHVQQRGLPHWCETLFFFLFSPQGRCINFTRVKEEAAKAPPRAQSPPPPPPDYRPVPSPVTAPPNGLPPRGPPLAQPPPGPPPARVPPGPPCPPPARPPPSLDGRPWDKDAASPSSASIHPYSRKNRSYRQGIRKYAHGIYRSGYIKDTLSVLFVAGQQKNVIKAKVSYWRDKKFNYWVFHKQMSKD